MEQSHSNHRRASFGGGQADQRAAEGLILQYGLQIAAGEGHAVAG